MSGSAQHPINVMGWHDTSHVSPLLYIVYGLASTSCLKNKQRWSDVRIMCILCYIGTKIMGILSSIVRTKYSECDPSDETKGKHKDHKGTFGNRE